MGVAVVLAHEGGWDEVLFVAAPLMLFAAMLIAAKRRAERMVAEDLNKSADEAE